MHCTSHADMPSADASSALWLTQAQASAKRRDPVDALNDAEVIEHMAWKRLAAMTNLNSPAADGITDAAAGDLIGNPGTSYWLRDQLTWNQQLGPGEAVVAASKLVIALKRRLELILCSADLTRSRQIAANGSE